MIEVGEKCQDCKYWGFWTQTCDYMLYKKRSRQITDGKIIDPKFCDKFDNGKRENKAKERNEYLRDRVFHP